MDSIVVFGGVRGYEKDGVAFLHIEDVARGLGITTTVNDAEYVRWPRVDEYLQGFGFLPQVANSENPHDYYIPENIFYRLCMKARNAVAEAFQAKVADEIIPEIRRTGKYEVSSNVASYMIEDPIERAKRWIEEQIAAKKALEDQEREARRTKAIFIEGRDAEMCGRVGGLTTQNERLREKVGDSKNYKSVIAIKWLPDYFVLSQGLYSAIAFRLKSICAEIDLPSKEIPDSRYGKVKIYPVKAIDILHDRVHKDDNMLKKYRKAS